MTVPRTSNRMSGVLSFIFGLRLVLSGPGGVVDSPRPGRFFLSRGVRNETFSHGSSAAGVAYMGADMPEYVTCAPRAT